MSQIFSTFRAKEHRIFLKIWLIYLVAVPLLYLMLPITFERNWLDFFDPLKNGYMPYVDFHVGYPPMGFLPYASLAILSGYDILIFALLMKIVGAFFLAMSVWLVYLIAYKIRGLRDAILSASIIMLSLSVFSYSRFANEPLELFFALLSIYFLLERRTFSAGLAIGLGAMVKLIPGLLIIPGIKRLTKTGKRILLIGVTFSAILFLNLPFMISSPLMWSGTYSYNSARGPWETIWALIEGWYSHGGSDALHPSYEVFIPYSQLAMIYSPSHLDTAFYIWNYPVLPTLLTVAGLASILLSYVLANQDDVVQGAALTIFLFMLFSKGYSPEFTIFMLPFMALAFTWIRKIILSVMLEVATIIESIVWAPGYYSQSLLSIAVIIRTVTLLVATGTLILYLVKKLKITLPRMGFLHAKNFRGKLLATFAISTVVAAGSAYHLISQYRQFPPQVQSQTGTRNLRLGDTIFLPSSDLTKNERMMFNLTSESPINVTVFRHGSEKAWVNEAPAYDVKNLIIAQNEGDYSLAVNMTYPASNFKIIDEARGDGVANFEQVGDGLNVTINDSANNDADSILKLSWPTDTVANDNFSLSMNVSQFNNHVNETLSLSTTNGVFEFKIPILSEWHLFQINSSSITSDDHPFSAANGSRIETMDLEITVDHGSQSGIAVRDFQVNDGKSLQKVDLTINNTSQVFYKVYLVQLYALPNSQLANVSYAAMAVGAMSAWTSLYKYFKKTDH